MSIESVLYARLSDIGGGLYALVGTRIYPMRDPQGVDTSRFPCVTYQRVSETRSNAFNLDSGVVDALFQIDCWATSFDGVRALCDAVRERLQRWRNNTGTIVQDSFIENVHDEYDEEAEVLRAVMQARIFYRE